MSQVDSLREAVLGRAGQAVALQPSRCSVAVVIWAWAWGCPGGLACTGQHVASCARWLLPAPTHSELWESPALEAGRPHHRMTSRSPKSLTV